MNHTDNEHYAYVDELPQDITKPPAAAPHCLGALIFWVGSGLGIIGLGTVLALAHAWASHT